MVKESLEQTNAGGTMADNDNEFSALPNEILSLTDRGDDTQRRYRYQNAYTVLLAIRMYNGELPYKEIYCELHEDILAVNEDGTYVGIQIKTRNQSEGSFDIGDEAVKESLIRFIKHYKKFPNRFSDFQLVSNCGFRNNRSGKNLVTLLELAKSGEIVETDKFDNFVQLLIERTGGTREEILDVLAITSTQTGPGMNDIEAKIIANHLARLEICKDASLYELEATYSMLLDQIYGASSKRSQNGLEDYAAFLGGKLIEQKAELCAKRITKHAVGDLLGNYAKLSGRSTRKDYGDKLLQIEALEFEKSFVKTPFYEEAAAAIRDNKLVLISGDSRMGKTITSIMAVAAMNSSYETVYGLSLGEIFKIVQGEPDRAQVILVHDFAGQDELFNDEYLSEANRMIETIFRLPKKKLVLNSRKSILKKLEKHKVGMFKFLHHQAIEVEIDFTKSSTQCKLDILLRYIKLNQLSKPFLEQIRNLEVLTKILTHPNFSPLVIKYATQPKEVVPEHYVDYFIKTLQIPDEIWKIEIAALNYNAKVYLYTLVSLTKFSIDKAIVDKCYYKRLSVHKEKFVDETLEKTIGSLNGTLLRLTVNGRIQVCHPSLNTFMQVEIGELEKRNIIDNALFIEQLEYFNDPYSELKLKELMSSNDFFELEVLPVMLHYDDGASGLELMNTIKLQYLKYIHLFGIEDKRLEPHIIKFLKRILPNRLLLFHSLDKIIIPILSTKFYDLSVVLSNDKLMEVAFISSHQDNIWELLKLCFDKKDEGVDFLTLPLNIQKQVRDKLDMTAQDEIDGFIYLKLDEYIEDQKDEWEWNEWDDEDIEEKAKELIEDIAFNHKDEIKGDAQKAIFDRIQSQKIYNFDIESLEYYDSIDYSDDLYSDAEKKLVQYLRKSLTT